MRLRNIPGADDAILNSEYCIKNPEEQKGHWQDCFETAQPLHIEIGMGKGRFIMDMAALHPDINYIGIERYSSVLLRALQKMEQNPLPNIKFICMDAADVAEVFAKDEVDRYDQILKKEGHLEFKTDNQDLFTFSLEEVPEAGWKLDASTRDLHHDAVLNEGNVMTEYEEKFSSKGNPICKLIASR